MYIITNILAGAERVYLCIGPIVYISRLCT